MIFRTLTKEKVEAEPYLVWNAFVDSLGDKSKVIGGWFLSLLFALGITEIHVYEIHTTDFDEDMADRKRLGLG